MIGRKHIYAAELFFMPKCHRQRQIFNKKETGCDKEKEEQIHEMFIKRDQKKKRTIIQQTAIGEVQTLVRVVTFPGGEALETFLSLSTNK